MYSHNRGDHVLPVELKVAPNEVAAATTPEPPPPQQPVQTPRPKGRVGVGTWATRSEFKDMKVTVGDKVVYSINPATATKDWTFGEGEWKWDGDVLKQLSDDQNCRALVGDPEWTDFTYTLKARKLSGEEGFLVLFHAQDDGTWVWWNVGGWGNTRTAIQRARNGGDRELGEEQRVTVDPNRWYDVKIDVEGRQIRCYLDGKLVAERTDGAPPAQRNQPQPKPAPMYATAVRDDTSGDVILRVINTEAAPHTVIVDLQGVKDVAKQANVEVLSGEPMAVNSVENPKNIFPERTTIENAAATFTHEFPAHSFSVVRLKAR